MTIYLTDTKPATGNVVTFDKLEWETKAVQCLMQKLGNGCNGVVKDSKTKFGSVRKWLKKAHKSGVKEDAVMPVDVLGWASDTLQGVTSLPPEP